MLELYFPTTFMQSGIYRQKKKRLIAGAIDANRYNGTLSYLSIKK